MASMNVSLSVPMREWVQGQIDSGSYESASEYVRDLIRRDQARASQQRALVDALIEGEQSGISPRAVTDILAAIRKGADGPG